ncbi:XRE family transcriptional regulator [Bacillus sp. RC]|nr:XRE family transcriptional regulator [Bacillus sp. RC]
MSVSYNKLRKLLIDKGMNKTMLREKAKHSSGTIAKLGKNENLTTDVLVKICKTLNCDISDVIEISGDK